MSGEITIDNPGVNLGALAAATAVVRYDPSQEDEGRYILLPNIVCEQIERGIGAHPSTAHFRYLLDTSGQFEDWPSQFDEIWPQTSQSSQYVVTADDRIAVLLWDQSGNQSMVFDGFAQIPQVNLDPSTQRVSFTASGSESRAWDSPINGRLQRGAANPDSESDNNQRLIDLPVRFNPSDGRGGIIPNCIPDGSDINRDDPAKAYPDFIEENLRRDPDPRTPWTVAKAAAYILGEYNKKEEFIKNPDLSVVRDNLAIKVPNANNGDGVVDPTDPETYTIEDLDLRDYDATNKPWPEVLAELCAQVGFGFYFSTPLDSGSGPQKLIIFYRIDQSEVQPVEVDLAEYDTPITDSVNDVAAMSLARDLNQVVNAWSVETPLRRVEASIVLAPGFEPAAGDEVAPARSQFLRSRLADASAETIKKYRWYVGDECADGHWGGTNWDTTPLNLDDIFPRDDDNLPTYIERFRPGSRRILTRDSEDNPRRAIVHYSFDYPGDIPGVWDGTGTWIELPGGWRLLDDRLGIECTNEDPEQWFTGKGKPDLKGITWQANPPAGEPTNGKPFVLMLTTTFDDDINMGISVPARIASPTKFERRRRIDARDHYQLQTVYYPSWYNQEDGGEEIIIRDDTDVATNLARQYRTAHEMPPLSGSITVPYYVDYYALGDLVSKINGRDVSLHTNAATDKGEGKRYPFIVKLAQSFSGDQQSTTIHLSDLRAEPRA